MSISEKLAKWSYGKSDKVNAAENRSDGFQRGYRTALSNPGIDVLDLISAEWNRIRQPNNFPEDFKDFKRGLWAASLQRAEARLTRHTPELRKEI